MRENADFWRWFTGELLDQPTHWMPTPPAKPAPASAPASQPASTRPVIAATPAEGKS
jgi:hypothetical protein